MSWSRAFEYAAALVLAVVAGGLFLLMREMELVFGELGIRLPAISESFLTRIGGVAPWWLVVATALAVTVAIIASLGDDAAVDEDVGRRGGASPWVLVAGAASVALLVYGILACFLPLLTTINKLEG